MQLSSMLRFMILPTLAVAATFSPTAQADTVVLAAGADTTLFSESGDLSNGRGQHLFVGVIATGGRRRALLRFDLSGIPSGAQITSATLELRATRTAGGGIAVGLHRVVGDWGEGNSNSGDPGGGGAQAAAGDATWIRRVWPGTSWTTAGGDAAGSPSATTTVGNEGLYQWTGGGLVGDVQDWLNQPGSNTGWLLRSTESGAQNAKRFGSRDNSLPADQPRLVVEFNAPQAPPLAAFAIPVWNWSGLLLTILLILVAGFAWLAGRRN